VSRVLSEGEIADLLAEPKVLPENFRARLRRRTSRRKPNERVGKLDVVGERGNKFRLIVRVNDLIYNNFSVLIVWLSSSGEKTLLVRCNGFHERHVNRMEKTIIPSDTCHVHTITERYQNFGKPDGFAEETFSYFDVRSAIQHVSTRYGFYRARQRRENQRNLPGIDD